MNTVSSIQDGGSFGGEFLAPTVSSVQLTATLERARQAIEGKFLQTGETLEQAVEIMGGLIGSLDGLVAALDPTTVDATTQDLGLAASRLIDMSSTHRGRRTKFEDLALTGKNLGQHIIEMRRSLTYLRVFAVNIKITAAGIAAAGAEFGGFAEEIYASIEQGRVQLDEFAGELADLDAQVAAGLSHQVELEARCAQAIPSVPNQLQSDAVAIADHHKQVAQAAARVGALARSIQMKVAGVLAALQVGDSTRQRIEHVQSALKMLADAEVSPAHRPAFDGLIQRMLAAQLEDTAEAFGRDVDKIAQNLAGMSSDAREILELRHLAQGGASDGGFLKRLESSVGDAMALVGEIEDAGRGAETVSRSAQSTAVQLAERVALIRTIKAEIQMMALNANLKCSRMGDEGRPLGVIAIEMRAYAMLLDETAGDTELALADLSGGCDAAPDVVHADGDIGGLLQDAAARIGEAGDAADADLAGFATQGEAIVSGLAKASSRLNLRADVGDVLQRVAGELNGLAGPEAFEIDEAAAGALDALMGKIGALYTMAREREIHREFAETCAPPALAAVA